jgi:predicted nicotinamide N-methyase
LDASLAAIVRIREERLKFVTMVGESLTPWEAQRLTKASAVADLLEQAHRLLARAQNTHPNTVRGPTTDDLRAMEGVAEAAAAARASANVEAALLGRFKP